MKIYLANNKPQSVLLAFCLLFFILFARFSIRNLALTADEEKHYRYGENFLAGDTDRFDDSKMPFSALNALPKKIGSFFPDGRIRHFLQTFQTARTMTILFSALVGLLVYFWGKALFGVRAGFLSLVLYIFDPNIIAHSGLVTTDIYITGMILASMFSFWRYLNQPNWKTLIVAAAVVGISQLAKYTGIFLYPLILLAAIFFYRRELLSFFSKREGKVLRVGLIRGFGHAVVFLAVGIVVINIGFLFNRTFTPLQDYQFRSELFQGIQDSLSFASNLPVPTPYPYLEGLDWVVSRERTGAGYGDIYLLGEIRSGEGFAGYYFVAAALKTPIASLIFIIAAFIFLSRNPGDLPFRPDGQFLLLPVLLFTIYFNFLYRAQIGIRFFLIVYPFLYIFCGILLRNWEAVTKRQRVVGGVLLLYLIVSVGSYFPHYIPYTNEIIWDKKMAYKYLADSNLDWEFGDMYLEEFLDEHPNAKYEPPRIVSGTVVVSINELVGVTSREEEFAWLRENFEPVDTIVHEYLVYQIHPEDIEQFLEQK